MPDQRVIDLLNTKYSAEKVKDMTMVDLQVGLESDGLVSSVDTTKMIIVEALQNMAKSDDEFPVYYYGKDEDIPEERREIKDPGPMLTDNYIASNFIDQ